MRLRRLGRDLLMALVAPGVVVALLAGAEERNAAERFQTCQSNLRRVGTALEMYSTDARGRYPASLRPLEPSYLRALPTCPSSGRIRYESASEPDAYTLLCDGDHEVPPEWDSADGGMMGKVAY